MRFSIDIKENELRVELDGRVVTIRRLDNGAVAIESGVDVDCMFLVRLNAMLVYVAQLLDYHPEFGALLVDAQGMLASAFNALCVQS